MSKQLIVLLDGTWNDADVGPTETNIVRLRELINRSLSSEPTPSGSKSFAADRKSFSDDIRRLIFYERGVGTGAILDQFYGGAFGRGLGDNVRRAYKFLSWYYEPGDKIFVFGFSRGAYTARSLVGLLGASGLLKRDSCTEDLEEKAWDFYRTVVNDRFPSKFDELTPHVHDRDAFKVACVGVFDTVGALGVPLPVFFRKNRDIYGFHDVELGSITECNLHAMAIDEHREPFQATNWRKPKFKTFNRNMKVEQVWFSGSHGDVGGGYVAEWDRDVKTNGAWQHAHSLDDITLDWMLKRVLANFPNFPVRLNDQAIGGIQYPRVWKSVDETWAQAEHHEARTRMYLARPFVLRAINNYAGRTPDWPRHFPYFYKDDFVAYDRHSEALGEMVHISALSRYGQSFRVSGTGSTYQPENLRRVLPYIAATYGLAPTVKIRLPFCVVDWDGVPLDPNSQEGKNRVSQLFLPNSAAHNDLKVRISAVLAHTPQVEG